VGQVPVFISPRNSVAQLYPRALGSLSVAAYDSQSYGGVTLTRLHTESSYNGSWTSLYSFVTDRTENVVPNMSSIVSCVFVAAIT
jgi:hypothetical protein